MASGYFECACCGTVDMGEDESYCDACRLCECSDTEPQCRELLIDGASGIYIPKEFAENFQPEAWGVDAETVAILKAGPGHEAYWDAWEGVDGYVERDFDGKRYVLEQDGDLWAKCVGPASKAGG